MSNDRSSLLALYADRQFIFYIFFYFCRFSVRHHTVRDAHHLYIRVHCGAQCRFKIRTYVKFVSLHKICILKSRSEQSSAEDGRLCSLDNLQVVDAQKLLYINYFLNFRTFLISILLYLLEHAVSHI